MSTFVMLKRGEMTVDMLQHHPNAFLLLTLIATRARRTPNFIKKLDVCECQIGDYRSCGLTEQKYRTAKKVLENLGIVTFYTTNKGTIAKIINTDIYDINTKADNEQTNTQATGKQRTSNEQVTTNNNVNNLNKENNEKEYPPEIKTFVSDYQNYVSETFKNLAPKITDSFLLKCCKTIDQLITIDKFTFDQVFNSLQWASNDSFWSDQIKSLANVRVKGKNGEKKFVNMFTAYQKKDNKPLSKSEQITKSNINSVKEFLNERRR